MAPQDPARQDLDHDQPGRINYGADQSLDRRSDELDPGHDFCAYLLRMADMFRPGERGSVMTSPCMTCPEKGCGVKHDTCEKYAEYVKAYRRISQERFEGAELDRFLTRHLQPKKKRR